MNLSLKEFCKRNFIPQDHAKEFLDAMHKEILLGNNLKFYGYFSASVVNSNKTGRANPRDKNSQVISINRTSVKMKPCERWRDL